MIKNHFVYYVVKGTQVLVIDKDLVMHKHIMKDRREFRGDTRLVLHNADEPAFIGGADSTQIWTLQEIFNLKRVVFVTGHSKWPYIIIKEDHLCKSRETI